ncbi:MAG TPA: low temperature requirement protein A [Nocardioidaceae bacterium]|jgi:low temperature requirement protein LtrA
MLEPTDRPDAPERVEWLELFFDLVVVAAVAVFSDALREDTTWAGVGIFLVTYGAVWFAWVSVVMYTDVAAELTRVRTVVVSMLLLAVMAAAAPGHAGHRANAFAGAFVLVRVFAARGSLRTGRLMTSWPLLQSGTFTVPWIVSFWVPVPWKYVLWGAAVVFELGLVMVRGGHLAEQAVSQYQQRMDKLRQHKVRREPSRGSDRELPELQEVAVDREHLDERLGLFVIIVLGESVAALVLIAARSEWTREFVSTAFASFVLLVLLWLLTFSYGFASAPGVRLGDLAPRHGLPIHLLSTTGILLIGVGLGEAAATGERLHGLIVWLTCGGLALHALASGIAGLLGRIGRFWLLSCALPTVIFPLVVAVVAAGFEDGLGNPLLIWLLALPVGWQFLYAQRHSALLRLGKLSPSES